MKQPYLICMTPVRNEAWVLNAFLKATSLWADYIIIADQNSTDGSREIALSYPKVILVENKNPNFNESERQKMLIDEARKISGDKILFGLDADEIFTANFKTTDDWKRIINSKPGDVFWFRWAIMDADLIHFWSPKNFFPWMFHDDNLEPHGNYVHNIHSMRIPYPIEEKQMYYVQDFYVLHFHYVFSERVKSKSRFYKFVDFSMNHKSIVSLSRMYSTSEIQYQKNLISKDWLYSMPRYNFDIFENLYLKSDNFWFDSYIFEHLTDQNLKLYANIDIWDNLFCKQYNLKDPRNMFIKMLHSYLSLTNDIKGFKFIRMIDKCLKFLGI